MTYIFRFPADTPPLTYPELRARCGQSWDSKIGTTVTVYQGVNDSHEPFIAFYLYGLILANIYPDRVEFTAHGDRHMATTEWLARIVTDNGIGYAVWTDRFVRYLIAYDDTGGQQRAPLEGHTFPVREASPR